MKVIQLDTLYDKMIPSVLEIIYKYVYFLLKHRVLAISTYLKNILDNGTSEL